MFDLGWMELLIIGVTALIVVGPKDLPMMFKKVGNFVGRAKRMAREFKSTMEAAADETGLRETSDMLKKIDAAKDPTNFFENEASKVFSQENSEFKKNELDKNSSEVKKIKKSRKVKGN